MEGSSEEGLPALPRSASAAVPSLAHTGTAQCLPGSAFPALLQGDPAWPALPGLVAFPGSLQTDWVVESLSKGLEQLVLLWVVLWSKLWMLPALVLVQTQSKAH